MTENTSVWATLSKVDVSPFTEKKNGMTYLSWAHAWICLKDRYPDATFEKVLHDGKPYMLDEQGYAFVQVRVEAGGQSESEVFPVLDHKNKAVQHPDAFQVNTALQRCLAKTIAYLGLGAYVYAGEDIPKSAYSDAPKVTLNLADGNTLECPADKMMMQQVEVIIKEMKSPEEMDDFYKANKDAFASMKAFSEDTHAEMLGKLSRRKKQLEKKGEAA